ncbi:MAG: hypothetical protein AAGE03_00820 [Pseudomonadota bacterium]
MPWILNRISVTSGVYRGLLVGEGDPPALEIVVGDESLGNLTPSPTEGGWRMEGEIGTLPLTDGTRAVTIRAGDGTVLDSFAVICGLDAPQDLRAELAALRAEMTILKQAFRRHVTETE